MKLEITRATPDMAYRIKLRDADLREAMAWDPGVPPADLVAASLRASDKTFAGFDGDTLVFLGGFTVGYLGPNTVTPWLVGSDLVVPHRKRFMRASRLVLRQLHSAYPGHILCNRVAKDNATSRAYLRRLGFAISALPGDSAFDFFQQPLCVN